MGRDQLIITNSFTVIALGIILALATACAGDDTYVYLPESLCPEVGPPEAGLTGCVLVHDRARDYAAVCNEGSVTIAIIRK